MPINPRYIQEVESRDALVHKINKRFVDIALSLPRVDKRPRAAAATQSVLTADIINMSTHDLHWDKCRYICSKCGLRATKKNVRSRAMSSCTPPSGTSTITPLSTFRPHDIVVGPSGTHASHKAGVYRGVVFCWTCGAYGSRRWHYLRQECCGHYITSGALALSHLRLGLLPPGMSSWPAP